MTTTEWDTEYTSNEDTGQHTNGNADMPKRTRRTKFVWMVEDATVGPMLAAHIAQHADQIEADAREEGADPRIVASTVAMLRRFADQINEYHGGEH